jgi:hypothetical protein
MANTRRREILAQHRKIEEIIDSPMLPALVEHLPARSLSELIDRIGIENSQPLIAHASNDQIKGVFDIQLWSAEPGKEDKINVDDFFTYLHSWLELGPAFVSEKLIGLGDEFVAMCFARHLSATDRQKVGLLDGFDFSNAGYDFGIYDVAPKAGLEEIGNEQIWSTLLHALEDLQSVDGDFLDDVLRRCSFERSILKEDISEHHVAEDLQFEAGEIREKRSEKSGFVIATDAFAFLTIAREAALTEVISMLQYDSLSRRYFKLPREEPTPMASTDENVSELIATLQGLGIGVKEDRRTLLLPNFNKVKRNLLEQSLIDLRQESEFLFEKRTEETMYLANVLISGIGLHGNKFSEMNAVKAVKATCNLGLDYIAAQPGADSEELYFELLSPEPGLLRPFQIGFHLLNQLPMHCAEFLSEFLGQKKLAARLRRLSWISAELNHLMPGTIFIKKAKERRFEELRTDVQLLSLVLDHTAVHCLDYLLDPFPVFPRILGMQSQPIRLDRSIRFIETLQDLDAIHGYVSNLTIDI